MKDSFANDVAAIQSIKAVPAILEAVAEMTGLGFVCVAHVTENSWTACAVLDRLQFGIKPGDSLDVATTLCSEVRDARTAIVIDNVPEDKEFCNHHTPRMYGFASYISVPIFLPDGEYFGNLCGLDPLPAQLSSTRVLRTMELFCDLIALQLEAAEQHAAHQSALSNEKETSGLREQFIAVLGHDLRTPLTSILTGTELLLRQSLPPQQALLVERVQRSGRRIQRLADDMMDFARGRMGGGMQLDLERASGLGEDLLHVVAELRAGFPSREIQAHIDVPDDVVCDRVRVAQLLSNLLNNALTHGAPDLPVTVSAMRRDGHFVLAVKNHGPSIPKEAMPRLFHPYWRGAGKRQPEGLGLGLYIAAEIARSHGGSLEVQSHDDDGTIFRFVMPAAPG